MIDWLDPNLPPDFPPTELALAEPNGLLAAGGQLSPSWLISAYQQGVFPWSDPGDINLWWSPAPRTIITPDTFRIPRTVRKLMKRQAGTITHNTAFDAVITACSEPREQQQDTWISEEMIEAYGRLHRMGYAHSIEHWSESGELIGGYYGVLLGAVFFGESMFSRRSNASKIAFAASMPIWIEQGLKLIDCQMNTAHLAQFGSEDVDRISFEERLNDAIKESASDLPRLL